MSDYRHSQPTPRMMIIISLVILAFVAWLSPDLRLTCIGFIALIVVGYFLFHSLTIEVSAQELQWYFGPGILRKRIALSDIANVEPVNLPRMSGTGIGYTGGGWAYFVKQGPAVRIHRKDGSIVTLGTDDQAGLLTALPGKQG
jgi:hypothetical protein